eukprot:scaffold124629_cov33-Prasinocladus_malaysianus.AAC.1
MAAAMSTVRFSPAQPGLSGRVSSQRRAPRVARAASVEATSNAEEAKSWIAAWRSKQQQV